MSLKKRQTFDELMQENKKQLMNDEAWQIQFEEKLEKRTVSEQNKQ